MRYAGRRVGGLLRRVRHLSRLERQRRGRAAPARRTAGASGRAGTGGSAGPRPAPGPRPRGPGPPRRDPKPDRVVAPVASVKQAQVTLPAAAPATFEIDVKNDSTIVDSYTIHAADPPPWLTVTHGEANLLPGVLRTVPVTFSITPGVLAIAQRVTVPLFVRSGVDPSPRHPALHRGRGAPVRPGGHPGRAAEPDPAGGRQRGQLPAAPRQPGRQLRPAVPARGTDPEGVVRLDFVPPPSTYHRAGPPRRPCASPLRRHPPARSCPASSS